MCGFPSSECVNKFFIFRWRFGGDVVNGLWYYRIRYSTQLNLTRLNLWYFHWVRLLQECITIYHHTFGNKATHKRTTSRYDFFCAKFCSLSHSLKRSMNIYIVLYAHLLKYLYSLSIAFDLYVSFFSHRSLALYLPLSFFLSFSRQSDSDIHTNTCKYANKAQELREKLIWKYV